MSVRRRRTRRVVSAELIAKLANRFEAAIGDIEAAVDQVIVQVDLANEASAVLMGLVASMRREASKAKQTP